MGKTSIEWTDASWNPIVGCTEISPGCANCYAARLAATRLRNTPAYKGLAMIPPKTTRTGWTGEVHFLPERLEEPLHWKKPRRIFVCDMGDLFHEAVPPWWIESIFSVICRCPQHTFQILTKRAFRMHEYFDQQVSDLYFGDNPQMTKAQMRVGIGTTCNWPLPNVWLGVSVENQHFANERIPLLLATPAAVRWISAEPLLGPVDLPRACDVSKYPEGWGRRIDWIVCGGESGPNARPMHPDWARTLRDRCQAGGIPFFFKQWGQWLPCGQQHAPGAKYPKASRPFAAFNILAGHSGCELVGVGKKVAGRLLDGREWNEFPLPAP